MSRRKPPPPPKPPPTPMCCGGHSVWVDYGPRLQYFYCRKCKKEVKRVDDLGKTYNSGYDDDYLLLQQVGMPDPIDRYNYVGSYPCWSGYTNETHYWITQHAMDIGYKCNCGMKTNPKLTP